MRTVPTVGERRKLGYAQGAEDGIADRRYIATDLRRAVKTKGITYHRLSELLAADQIRDPGTGQALPVSRLFNYARNKNPLRAPVWLINAIRETLQLPAEWGLGESGGVSIHQDSNRARWVSMPCLPIDWQQRGVKPLIQQGIDLAVNVPDDIKRHCPDARLLPIETDLYSPALNRGDLVAFNPNQSLRFRSTYVVTVPSLLPGTDYEAPPKVEYPGQIRMALFDEDGNRTILRDLAGRSPDLTPEDVFIDGLVVARLPQFVEGDVNFTLTLKGLTFLEPVAPSG